MQTPSRQHSPSLQPAQFFGMHVPAELQALLEPQRLHAMPPRPHASSAKPLQHRPSGEQHPLQLLASQRGTHRCPTHWLAPQLAHVAPPVPQANC